MRHASAHCARPAGAAGHWPDASPPAEYPRHRDLLLFRAIAQRYLRRIPDALATLDALEVHYPTFSRLHEERGRCFVELKQAPEAIESFTRAVKRNPALLGACWKACTG